ncbi:MAG: hypothetical protein HYS25_00800 [Ignavibacteriales bacterium]|nr:hypothetical protein [Ignavibacteriales bacterium]
MQLIEIITDVLLYGGFLLLIVILVSFFLSRTKREEPAEIKRVVIHQKLQMPRVINYDQAMIRNQVPNAPQIHFINHQKELKVVRKPTVTERQAPENIYEREREKTSPRVTNENGQRYTIVNEEQQKGKKARVINFYL